MQQSKLIQLFSTLSPEELRRFRKLLQSPFFTTNEHLLKLFDVLKKYAPAFDSPKLTKTQIFQRVFPNAAYDDNKMRTLMKNYTKLLEDFLLYTETAEQDRQQALLQVYAKRNLYPLYQRNRIRLLQSMEEKPYRDFEYYQTRYTFDFDYFFHPQTPKHTLQDDALFHLMESIDMQFILAKYRITSEMKNRERILPRKYDIRFLSAIDKEGSILLESNILIGLFKLLFKLYETDEVFAFEQLKKKINAKN